MRYRVFYLREQGTGNREQEVTYYSSQSPVTSHQSPVTSHQSSFTKNFFCLERTLNNRHNEHFN
ncbi:MAG: hypothetical protein ACKO2Z_24130 [Sphaerospermopsis kisseleviana]